MSEIYTCAVCKGTFTKTRPDEVAAKEFEAHFGRKPERDELDNPVCGDCYELCIASSKFFVKFDMAALLRGDTASRYEAYAQALTNGFTRHDEIRSAEGLNPILYGIQRGNGPMKREEILAAMKGQHLAIDHLMAMLIDTERLGNTRTRFMPTQSAIWPLLLEGKRVIDALEAEEKAMWTELRSPKP